MDGGNEMIVKVAHVLQTSYDRSSAFYKKQRIFHAKFIGYINFGMYGSNDYKKMLCDYIMQKAGEFARFTI